MLTLQQKWYQDIRNILGFGYNVIYTSNYKVHKYKLMYYEYIHSCWNTNMINILNISISINSQYVRKQSYCSSQIINSKIPPSFFVLLIRHHFLVHPQGNYFVHLMFIFKRHVTFIKKRWCPALCQCSLHVVSIHGGGKC